MIFLKLSQFLWFLNFVLRFEIFENFLNKIFLNNFLIFKDFLIFKNFKNLKKVF